MHHRKRTFVVETARSNMKQMAPKPVRWSHQQELDKLIGQKIALRFINAESLPAGATGVLLAADQFTLQLALASKSSLTCETIPETFFKHAIRSYRAVIE